MDLGILPPDRRKSVRYCVGYGTLWVNLPVFLIMVGVGAVLWATGFLTSHTDNLWQLWPVLLPPLVPWFWWSAMAPRWRIWALRTVDDWPALEQAAIGAGLIWPRRSIFGKTEFKSRKMRALERALMSARDSGA